MDAPRSDDGRFSRRGVRDARTLYAILRAVAEAAVADRPRADPRKVSVRQWRDARQLCKSEFGHIPLPQEIRRQLAKLNGELLPFAELLAIAFGDRGSIDHKHSALQAAERNSPDALDDSQVWNAARYVARSLAPDRKITATTTLDPRAYERQRQRLIRADERRKTPRGLAERLPTHNQLTTYADKSWDRVLEIAGLAPRPRDRTGLVSRKPISVAEAIVRYYEVVGVLPSSRNLAKFRRGRFAMVSKYGRWEDELAEALRLIEKRGLPEPPTYEATKHLRVTVPPPSEDELDPDTPAYPRRYSNVQLITGVQRYVKTLRAGEDGSTETWVAFSTQHPGCPSSGVITDRGGLASLIEKARHPDALARAEAEDLAALAAKQGERVAASAAKEQAQQVLSAIEQLGGAHVGLAEIAEKLGWKSSTVGNWIETLCAAGKVEICNRNTGRKDTRYMLAELDLTPEQLEQKKNDWVIRQERSQRILRYLADSPTPRTASEIAEMLGESKHIAREWARKLTTAGAVEEVVPARRTIPRIEITYRISGTFQPR